MRPVTSARRVRPLVFCLVWLLPALLALLASPVRAATGSVLESGTNSLPVASSQLYSTNFNSGWIIYVYTLSDGKTTAVEWDFYDTSNNHQVSNSQGWSVGGTVLPHPGSGNVTDLLTISAPARTGNNSGYYYAVAYRAAAWSQEAYIPFNVAQLPSPPQPVYLETVAAADGSAVPMWYPEAGASYQIGRSTTSGGPYTTVATVQNGSVGTPLTYQDGGLTDGTRYYYVITPVSNLVGGPVSNEVSAVPSAAPVPLNHVDLNALDQHYLTASLTEYLSLLQSGAWTDDATNPQGYAYSDATGPSGLVPLYKLYYGGGGSDNGDHLFTTNTAERSSLISGGWADQGVSSYVFPYAVGGSTPLYRLYHPSTGQHSFITSTSEEAALLNQGWTNQGVNCYVLSGTLQTETAGPDLGFEVPALPGGTFQLAPPNAAWSYRNPAGVAANGSGYGNPSAPEGAQAAFLQSQGAISQSLPGFQSGYAYFLTVAAAQRNYNGVNTQQVQVQLDGAAVGTVAPAGTAYRDYTVGPFAAAAGSHTLAFVGLNPNGGDNTAFLDNVRLVGHPQPSVTASAAPNPATGTTTTLTAAVSSGTAPFTYAWSATGPASVTFSANNSSGASSTTATFTQLGTYTFTVLVTDAYGLTASASVTVTVRQTPQSLAVSPRTAALLLGGTQQYSATGIDQFGGAISSPAVTWSATGDGSISPSGLFTAGSGPGNYTVTATAGSVTATASGTVNVRLGTGGAGPGGGGGVLAAPLNLTATPGNAQVSLNWTAVGGATGYNVYRATAPAGPYNVAATGVSGTRFVDAGLTNGTAYSYVVTAVSAGGESASSNVATATPAATAGPQVTASARPSPVTGTTTTLTAAVTDSNGTSGLTYAWTAAGPAAVTLGAAGASSTGATFTRAGGYTFAVLVTDAYGLTATATAPVTVTQTVTTLSVTPTSASVPVNGSQSFTAAATDQFGQPLSGSSVAWAVSPASGAGSVSPASGTSTTYAAPPAVPSGAVTVTATAGGTSAGATVTVVPGLSITSLSPSSIPAGTNGLTLTINGTNFAANAQAMFNGNSVAGVSSTATQLIVTVPAGLLATSGVFPVFVKNPTTNTTSNTLPFTVTTTAPADVPPPGWAAGAVPTDGGSDAGGFGPSSSIGVSLPAQVAENTPGPDVWAYNPLGPGASFERMYRGNLVAAGHAAPGLSVGWTDNYDLTITAGAGGAYTLNYPDGAQEPWTTSGGAISPPPGAPYLVGQGNGSLVVTFKDHSRLTFTPAGDGVTYWLTGITNLVGHAIAIGRDTANGGRITAVTNDAGATLLQFNYGGAQLLSVVAPDHQVNYTFTGGNLSDVSQIGTLGATPADRWKYGYTPVNGLPYLSSVQAPNPAAPGGLSAATINYDGSGHVQSVVNAPDGGGARSRAYAPVTGATSVSVFNKDGSLAQGWLQNFTGGTNADAGFTDANNHSDTVTYGGSPSPYLPAADMNRNAQTTSLTYDQYGNPLTVTTPRGDVVTNMYSYSDFGLGELTSSQETHQTNGTTDATKQATTFDYYTAATGGALYGLVKDVYSPAPDGVNGGTVTTTFAYTPFSATAAGGQVSSVTAPGNNNGPLTTAYNYAVDGAYTQNEALGEPLTVTDAAGDITHFRYDGRGNVVSMTDANTPGNTTTYAYNLADQLTQEVYPVTTGSTNARTVYNYQYVGGPLASEVVYDEGGNPVREVDTNYTAEGEVASVTGSTEPAFYAYDGRSRVAALQDGDGNTTRYVYDGLGDLMQTLYPGYAGSVPAAAGAFDTETLGYDADQNLTSRTDGRGAVTTYARQDPESLVTGVSYANLPSGVTNIGATAYAYDVFGRRSLMTDITGTTAYTQYDDLDELLAETRSFPSGGPQGQALSWAHYPDGSLKQMGTPGAVANPLPANGGLFSYAYDGAGRLTQVTAPFPGGSLIHTYQPNGWPKGTDNLTMPGASLPSTRTFYTFNARGFLTNLQNYQYDPTQGADAFSSDFTQMAYDAVGNRLGLTADIPAVGSAPDASRQVMFGYDIGHSLASQNRDVLTGEASTTSGTSGSGAYLDAYSDVFGYDPAYNPTQFSMGGTSATPGYNADNQAGGGGRAYDGDGNPTTYAGMGASGAFTFDPEDRLTGIASPAFSALYDGDGLRAMKTARGTTTYFLNDGAGRPTLEEIISGGSARLSAVNLFGADGWRARYDEGGNQFYAYTFDPQGNVVQRQNSGDTLGSAYDTASYEGYGRRGADYTMGGVNPAPVQQPAGFGGQYGYYTDIETGLLSLTHRYYDPGTGRFINRDPAGYGGGVNLYGFAGGNPVNEIDPDGLNPLTDWLGRQWGRFARWQLGKVGGDRLGKPRGDEGLDAEEMEDTSPLDQRPQASAQELVAGERQVAGIVGEGVAGAPVAPEAAAAERTFEVLEQEGNLIILRASGPKGEVRILASHIREGETLVLRGAHIEGPGAGKVGREELRNLIEAYGKQNGLSKIIVEGAERSTGKMIGRLPRPITYEIK